jgi:hypothetical protein
MMLIVSAQCLSGCAVMLPLSAISLLVRTVMLSLRAPLVRSAMFFECTLHLSVLAVMLPPRALLPLVRATMLFASALCPLLCSVRPPARAQRKIHLKISVRYHPLKFQSDIIHRRIKTKNQAVLAAGASKKTQIRLAY